VLEGAWVFTNQLHRIGGGPYSSAHVGIEGICEAALPSSKQGPREDKGTVAARYGRTLDFSLVTERYLPGSARL